MVFTQGITNPGSNPRTNSMKEGLSIIRNGWQLWIINVANN